MYRGKRIAVIIPAHNEENIIAALVNSIPHFVDTILVVDNGSTDNTYAVLFELSKDSRVIPLKERKRGYGNACLKGMASLTDHDIVVFLDADYSDDPAIMHRLLDPLIDNRCAMVVSNRFTSMLEHRAMTIPQMVGNKFTVLLIKLLWGYRYKDLGPFRSILLPGLYRLKMSDKNYGWTVEMQIKALQQGFRVCQVDVPYQKRKHGKSKVSRTVRGVVFAGTKILWTTAVLFIRQLQEIDRGRKVGK